MSAESYVDFILKGYVTKWMLYILHRYRANWNILAAHPIMGEELTAILREEAAYNKPVRSISRSMIHFIGLLQPFMGKMVEMMYLAETPIVLSGDKYESEIGPLPSTPYRGDRKETLIALSNY